MQECDGRKNFVALSNADAHDVEFSAEAVHPEREADPKPGRNHEQPKSAIAAGVDTSMQSVDAALEQGPADLDVDDSRQNKELIPPAANGDDAAVQGLVPTRADLQAEAPASSNSVQAAPEATEREETVQSHQESSKELQLYRCIKMVPVTLTRDHAMMVDLKITQHHDTEPD